MIDYNYLWKVGKTLAPQYESAQPFPHIVLDDFLPAEMVVNLLEHFPAPESEFWKLSENPHTINKRDIKYVAGMSKDASFGRVRGIFHELNSGSFLEFLQRLTKLQEQILPDPYFVEGGFHLVGDRGRLDPHADFSHHPSGMERRLNLLLYLNDGWKPEYGGNLNLYDTKLNVLRTIEPVINRCVIFSTSETSFHGHPEPMNLPAGVWRRSLAMYYYTSPTGRMGHKAIFPRV